MMIKKVIRIIGILLGSLVGLILLTGIVLYFMGNARLNKKYDFPLSNITVLTDAASIEYGKQRTEFFCTGCHGEDLGGVEGWLDLGALGTLDSANLTSGEGGVGREYTTDEDFVRALRHGIDPEGKPIYMPAVSATSHLSDQDLAAIIAYLKTVPPVDHKMNGQQFTPLAKVLLALKMLPPPPVETVSHAVHVAAPEVGVTVEYGTYLVDILDCRLCHGQELEGGNFPDPTINVKAPSIASDGEVGFWSEEQFIDTLRTGTTPGGHVLDPELMPWKEISEKATDDELKAIYMYLRSLPKPER
ncbi:MAG TPA: cytochrome c [Anaerolineales bacterium]|nr:cytochrome c [Anaerolineales bacterium]